MSELQPYRQQIERVEICAHCEKKLRNRAATAKAVTTLVSGGAVSAWFWYGVNAIAMSHTDPTFLSVVAFILLFVGGAGSALYTVIKAATTEAEAVTSSISRTK